MRPSSTDWRRPSIHDDDDAEGIAGDVGRASTPARSTRRPKIAAAERDGELRRVAAHEGHEVADRRGSRSRPSCPPAQASAATKPRPVDRRRVAPAGDARRRARRLRRRDTRDHRRPGSPGALASIASAWTPAAQLVRQKRVHGAVPGDAAHAREGGCDDLDTKMRAGRSVEARMVLAGAVMMAGMEVAFVDNGEAFGRKGVAQLVLDRLAGIQGHSGFRCHVLVKGRDARLAPRPGRGFFRSVNSCSAPAWTP